MQENHKVLRIARKSGATYQSAVHVKLNLKIVWNFVENFVNTNYGVQVDPGIVTTLLIKKSLAAGFAFVSRNCP